MLQTNGGRLIATTSTGQVTQSDLNITVYRDSIQSFNVWLSKNEVSAEKLSGVAEVVLTGLFNRYLALLEHSLGVGKVN